MNPQVTLEHVKEGRNLVAEKSIFSFAPIGFAPLKVTLSYPEPDISWPSGLPTSFIVQTQVLNGNINLNISNVEYSPLDLNLYPAIWQINSTIVNAQGHLTVVLEDSLGNLLVLTSTSAGVFSTTGKLDGTWESILAPNSLLSNSRCFWQAIPCGTPSSFRSEFSWNFLIARKDKYPQSVVMNFSISSDNGKAALEWLSSFPDTWGVKCIEDSDSSLFMKLTYQEGNYLEVYNLQQGLFVGAFNSLVCQGTIASDDPSTPLDDGTWTGTSGGPLP